MRSSFPCVGLSGWRLITLAAIVATTGCAADPAPEPARNDREVAADPFREWLESPALELADVLALVVPSEDDRVPDQVVLAARADASPKRVMQVLKKVEEYPNHVDQVVRVDILERSSTGVTFEMELEVPLQNLVYELAFSYPSDDRIEVVGLSGVLEGGRFSWEVFPRGDGASIVYSTRATLSEDAGLLVNAILQIHPDLQEGLMFAQGLRFLRAIRDASEAIPVETPVTEGASGE